MTNEKTIYEDLHFDIFKWKTDILPIKTDMQFLFEVLDSKTFKTEKPQKSEHSYQLKEELKKLEVILKELDIRISKHENKLGSLPDCNSKSCNNNYYNAHKSIQSDLSYFITKYNVLKSDIISVRNSTFAPN